MTLITDLDTIHRRAQEQQDAYAVMKYQLQYDDDLRDDAIDAAVERIAAGVIAAIDCTECGNCCRSLDVYLRDTDAERLAAQSGISTADFVATFIDQDAAQAHHEWGKFRHSPCAFLRGNSCTVYDERPHACREYPVFTPDFRWILDGLIEGAAHCPIIFNVLQQMLTRVDEMQQSA